MDPLNLSIFDSDEDEFVEDIVLHRNPKVFKNRINYLEEYDDFEFFKRFRIQKPTFVMLCDTIEHQITSATDRNNAIAPATKLFLALRFYATGNMLIAAGDYAGVSKTSACNIVTQVTEAIASLRPRYIKFPVTHAEKQIVKEDFYRIARFPHVIGAIDCTHVRINSPGGIEAERYRNRKGYFSWNVQTICDAKLRVTDIVARWSGSSHDQTIFSNSRIKGVLQNNEFGTSIILGDSGYANTNYLITPLGQTNTPAENLFNESHIRTRNCVERLYGVWKRRFPILSMGMRCVCL
ncbi:hypothetical protein RI129_005646 [Pyrocoelia pectoralis]|uniref:Putative nuclease HARBI1 n=1 Tax=Pyrocoelia pectoralis TaxID=417401 RepID=A0AAN7ZNL3_9COLE